MGANNYYYAREMIMRHEGTGPVKDGRFLLYKCSANKNTIGFGRNLDDYGVSENAGSKQDAESTDGKTFS